MLARKCSVATAAARHFTSLHSLLWRRSRCAVAGYVAEEMFDGVQGLATNDRREAAEILAQFPEAQRAGLLAEAEARARQILASESEMLGALAWRLQTVGSFP